MKTIKAASIYFLVILALLASTLAGCAPQVVKVEGAEADAVLQYTESMADTVFAAINAGDYAAFTKDMDEQMKKAMPESSFTSMLKTLEKVGKYQSRTVDHIEKVQNYNVVVYNAKFEQDTVTVRLTFNQADPHLVSGLWFTSPKLAK